MDARLFRGCFSYGYQTANADTLITRIIPGETGAIARVTSLVYRPAGTAHNLYFLRPCGSNTVASALAAAGTALILSGNILNPAGAVAHTPAANDYILVKLDNGYWHLTTISAWTAGTFTMTLSTAVPSGRSIAAGATVYFLGVVGDEWNIKFETTASTVLDLKGGDGGIAETGLPAGSFATATYGNRSGQGDPMLFISDNATAAGFLRQLSGYYNKM